jgi:hypothetical protein
MQENTLRPETINRLRSAVSPSFALLSGIQLDVFTCLKDGPLTGDEAAEALDVHPGKLEVLLCALLTTGLLEIENGRFLNSPEADRFLVRGRQGYLGDGYESFAAERWEAILKSADSIRSGKAQAQVDYPNASEEELYSHYRYFFNVTLSRGRNLAARFDFSGRKHMVDVAGGTGGLAVALTEAVPGLRATVVDLPSVTPITHRYVQEADASDRVDVVSTDVIAGPLSGSYDVAVVSAFLPVISAESARRALINVGATVEPGGVLYLTDGGILDDSRLSPPEVAFNGLYYINAFNEGGPKTEGDRRRWLEEAGFVDIERLPFPEGGSIMVAHKGK